MFFVGITTEPWSRAAAGGGWHALPAAAVIAVIVLLLPFWARRARTARRWRAALDAYAARELARGRRRKTPGAGWAGLLSATQPARRLK
jgi:hypothetical protein